MQQLKLNLSYKTQVKLAWWLLALSTIIYIIWISYESVLRYDTFTATAFDLGNMDQVLWNTIHGHLFQFTNQAIDWYGPPTRLAVHVEPILLVISLLYVFHADPRILLIFQTLVLAAGISRAVEHDDSVVAAGGQAKDANGLRGRDRDAQHRPPAPVQPASRAISSPPSMDRSLAFPVKGDKVNHLSNLGRALQSAPQGFSEMITSESSHQARTRPLLIVVHLAELNREELRQPQPGDKINHLKGEPLLRVPRHSELLEEAGRRR